MNVTIHPQARQTLAMVATPTGVEVRIPRHLDPGSERVQAFIAAGLAKLAANKPLAPERPLAREEVQALVDEWAQRLGVAVNRLQLQPMTQKWGSLSSNGNLTLASDVLQMPPPLLEYIIVHELLHVRHPHHARGFKVALGLAMPDWRLREQQLAAWLVGDG